MTAVEPLRNLEREAFRYDWGVALLYSLIGFFSAVALGLAALYLTNLALRVDVKLVPLELVEIALDSERGATGLNPELGFEEMTPEVTDPLEMPEMLDSLLDAISKNQVDLTEPKDTQKNDRAFSGAPGGLADEGMGDGSSSVPRFQRWSIEYGQQSARDYAAMLDFFGIEIGLVRGRQVELVSGFAQQRVTRKPGAVNDNRLYFQWRDPARKQADLDLLRRKGVDPAGTIVVQFFSPELENRLAVLEKQFENRPPEQIRKTVFAVKSLGNDQFEFFVQEQEAFR